MHIRHLKKAVLTITLFTLTACGDSTGPKGVTPDEALRSLARGFGPGSAVSLPFGMSPTALGNAAGLSQINVTIDGTAHSMHALGLRVTYPTGTCFESLFVFPIALGFPAGECTPPPLGLLLVLWETQSGSRPPDHMVVLSADVGTVDFDFAPSESGIVIPHFAAFGFYINDRDEFWTPVGGSLTSQVAATNETCAVAPPPFAKTSTCHVGTFDESGSITFEQFDLTAPFPSGGFTGQIMELVIPRQTIFGIVQAITETQPVTIPGPWDY
jgi:hypothetical protein